MDQLLARVQHIAGTSIGSFVETPVAGATMENVAAVLGDFIGGVTLTGSCLAGSTSGSRFFFLLLFYPFYPSLFFSSFLNKYFSYFCTFFLVCVGVFLFGGEGIWSSCVG